MEDFDCPRNEEGGTIQEGRRIMPFREGTGVLFLAPTEGAHVMLHLQKNLLQPCSLGRKNRMLMCASACGVDGRRCVCVGGRCDPQGGVGGTSPIKKALLLLNTKKPKQSTG